MPVFRYPAIFLIGVFFTLGPAPFERVHLAEANQALQRTRTMMADGSPSPLKRLPVRLPVHDPSACVICAVLHAPMTVQHAASLPLGPTARLGCLPVELTPEFPLVCMAAEQCRGPPSA
jgi:hypothetical protein